MRSQRVGNAAKKPSEISMSPLIHCQKELGISMKYVVDFRSKVKMMTDKPRDAEISSARLIDFCPVWLIEPPTITGRSGSTQGARVVSTPATKAPAINNTKRFF
jgi:hypothetical protein